MLEMLQRKREGAPPLPSQFVEGIPPELDDLCLSLLARKPRRRPTAAEALTTLTRTTRPESIPPGTQLAPPELFVGRATELAELEASFRQVLAGRARALVIEGESGMGKSALLAEFLRRARTFTPQPLIARGRCHAAEQLRFKAFDAVAEALAKKLARKGEALKLSRDDLSLAVLLFPTLASALHEESTFWPVRQPERAAMFRAFARLLEHASSEHPLIVAIDDLQWSDEDSL